MEPKSFDELVLRRKKLIDAHNENGFADGIRALLTDLYPDTAHFIYELLQNAEDMIATKVLFTLKEDRLLFAHNGIKRDFNLSDIDSITSIGNNAQKKNDPTSIGKFGVGFKAVFSYTATPEIHSGEYHFKIEDYFLPVSEGVRPISTLIEGQNWTGFVFPFNNPKKPQKQAYKEVLSGLLALDENSIMFLKNIRSIKYALPNGDIGYIESSEDQAHYLVIDQKKHDNQLHEYSYWLRFQKEVFIKDEQGIQKQLCIGVAYSIEQNTRKNGSFIIQPIDGKTFIYFPAVKEKSNLKFHINAPFASTVARDSVRDCPQNYELIDDIADLVVESLEFIKNSKMLTTAFFAVLPNDSDNLNDFFRRIAERVYQAFAVNAYVPTFADGYATSQDVLRAVPATIRNIIHDNDIKALTGSSKVWCANPQLQNLRAERFLASINIEVFSYDQFAYLFTTARRAITERFIRGLSDERLRACWAMIIKCEQDICRQYDTPQKRSSFKDDLQCTAIVKTTKGFTLPIKAYTLPVNQKLLSPDTPIVPHDLYDNERISSVQREDILNFFRFVGVKTYGLRTEIEELLASYSDDYWRGQRLKSNQHFKDILAFADYASKYNDIDFRKVCFIRATAPGTGVLYWTVASRIVIPDSFIDNAGDEVAKITRKYLLWSEYNNSSNIPSKRLHRLMSFLKEIGAQDKLQIEHSPVQSNPEYYRKLVSYRRNTGYGVNEDYSISDLDSLVKANSIAISRSIWDCIISYPEYKDVTVARHSVNAQEQCKVADSTLVCILKASPWIPTKDGSWKRPKEVTESMLLPTFRYHASNNILKAIGFGANQRASTAERVQAEELAKKTGGIYIAPEYIPAGMTAEDFVKEIQSARRTTRERIEKVDISAALRKQNKSEINSANASIDLLEDEGTVPDVKRRVQKISDSFIEGQQTPVFIKKRMGKVYNSSKDERERLKADYNGKCQICGTRITAYNGNSVFQAINIINTDDLPSNLAHTFDLCWNSLCLCPNCAAKYKYCSKKMDDFESQVLAEQVKACDGKRIQIRIMVGGNECYIGYTPRHFLALQTVYRLLQQQLLSGSDDTGYARAKNDVYTNHSQKSVVSSKVVHAKYGEGIIIGFDGINVTVSFLSGDEKRFEWEHAVKNGFLHQLD